MYKRRSIRCRNREYTKPGAYFLTILTHQRKHLFGRVESGKMILNSYGRIAEREWLKTGEMRPYLSLDAYVIMPDHIHMIIIINSVIPPSTHMDSTHCVRANCVRPSVDTETERGFSGSIGAVISGYKASVTRKINTLRNTPGLSVWQRNYFDRILREKDTLKRYRDYIHLNPENWCKSEKTPSKGLDPHTPLAGALR